MDGDIGLLKSALGLRIGLLVALIGITSRYSTRGLQNGILLGLVGGMAFLELFILGGGLPAVSVERVVWTIVWVVFLLNRREGRTTRLHLDGVERSMLAFVAVMLISMVVHGTHTTTEGGWNLTAFSRGVVIPFVAYFIARRGDVTNDRHRSFLIGIGFISIYLVLTSIAEAWKIEWLIFPSFILDPSVGIHYGKVRGIFLNASFNGLAIAMAFPVLIWLFLTDRHDRRWLWAAVTICAALPLAYTIQRAAWLSAAAALGVTTLAWPKRRAVLVGVLIVAASGSFFVMSDTLMERVEGKLEHQATIDARISLINASWKMFRENPVMGIGVNQFREQVTKYSAYNRPMSPHNTPLSMLAELGLFGFLPYMTIFGLLLFKSVNVYRQHADVRAFIGVLWGVTAAYAVMMMAIEMRSNLYANTLLFALWGMSLEAMRRHAGMERYRADLTQRRNVFELKSERTVCVHWKLRE